MCLSNMRNNCRTNYSALFTIFRNFSHDICHDLLGDPDPSPQIDDVSDQPFINDIWLVLDTSDILIKTFAFLPIVLWGILSNATLIYIIAKNRHLRSPTNLLIGNMALADLLSLLIHPWVFLVYDFFQNYQLGEFGCKVEGAFECALLLTSVMNLSAISYDRLTSIVLLQETKLTRRGAKYVMGITWIAGFVLASPLFFYRTYKERQWLDFLEKYCSEDTVVINIYWHVIITMMVWLPLIIMLVCYVSIFIKLLKYEKSAKTATITGVKYKAKVAKTMFTVVITFIICHLPFTALIFYRNQLLKDHTISGKNQVQNLINGTYQVLWFSSKYLIFVNAGINPVIYGLMNEKFRRVFKTIPIIKCIFVCRSKKRVRIIEEKEEEEDDDKRKTTKETDTKPKLFTIFRHNKV